MKKAVVFSLTLIFLLVSVTVGQAQTSDPSLDSLLIDVWPDYDRPSILILISGTFPENTPLPAEITIPMPEGADLLVVARIDAADGRMKDDITYTESADGVTLTTPDREFRVEYYIPYEANNLERSFDFTWTAPFEVNQAAFKLQQPSAATDYTFEPAAANTTLIEGLTYYITSAQPLSVGQSMSMSLNYTLAENRLSIEDLRSNITDAQTTFNEGAETAGQERNNNLPLIAVGIGVLLVLGALSYQLLMRGGDSGSVSPRQRKPRPTRSTAASSSGRGGKFCHNCGESIGDTDKFCANCGTAVKR